MKKILCATRGGEASYHTQDAAIQRAKETVQELIFFYAVDVEFLSHANYTLRSDVIEEELDNMGEFLMEMAVERARARKVSARYIVKHGNLLETLCETVAEEKVNLVVLGSPGEDSAIAVTSLDHLANAIQERAGVKVAILPESQDSSSA
jgi:nucleotide-binding universal stress UspA family protein